MTKEEIVELARRQQEIEDLRKALNIVRDKSFEIRFPEYGQYYRLPIDKLLGLREEIKDMLYENFSTAVEIAEHEMNRLKVCESKLEGPIYSPIKLVNDNANSSQNNSKS